MLYYHQSGRKFWGGTVSPNGDDVCWGGIGTWSLQTVGKKRGYLRGKENEKTRKGYAELRSPQGTGVELFFRDDGKRWWDALLRDIQAFWHDRKAPPELPNLLAQSALDTQAPRQEVYGLLQTAASVIRWEQNRAIALPDFQHFVEGPPPPLPVLDIQRSESTLPWAW